MLEAELEDELGYEKYETEQKNTGNARNGHSKKTVKTQMGNVDLEIPRDRNGKFEPQIIPKYKRNIPYTCTLSYGITHKKGFTG